jgi:phage terminase large subunit
MASKYYEPDWLFDSGKLFNLAVASRGSGKTFAFTRKLLQFAVKTKRKFVLLVRYANEIETYKMSGFGAINAWISDKGDLYGI